MKQQFSYGAKVYNVNHEVVIAIYLMYAQGWKVPAIKMLRTIESGLGLKEAKDICDEIFAKSRILSNGQFSIDQEYEAKMRYIGAFQEF